MLGLEHSAMHLHPGRAAHNEASPVLCAWLASGRGAAIDTGRRTGEHVARGRRGRRTARDQGGAVDVRMARDRRAGMQRVKQDAEGDRIRDGVPLVARRQQERQRARAQGLPLAWCQQR